MTKLEIAMQSAKLILGVIALIILLKLVNHVCILK